MLRRLSPVVLAGLIALVGCGGRAQVHPGVTAAPSSSPAASPSPAAHQVILIYGDSLTAQSETAVRFLYPHADVVFRAVPGAAMCDMAPRAAADRAAVKPTRVVLAFTGNTWGCVVPKGHFMGTLAEVVSNYEKNLRLFARSFQGIPMTVVASPAMKNPGLEGLFPYNGNPALTSMYQRVCAELGLRFSTVADDSLTPGHVYTAYRPAYGTASPPVLVRASDGIHLLPAGEVYYAVALMTV